MKIDKMNVILGYEACAIEHTTKIAELFEAMGFEVTANMGMLREKNCEEWGIWNYVVIKGSKKITISTVYRSNGTAQNVSTYIDLLETHNGENIDGYCGMLHRIERVKITKDAGERAISNKINKILEKF